MLHSKRLGLASVITGIVVLGTLTACAGGGGSPEPTKTVVATTTTTASPGPSGSSSPSPTSTDAAGGDTGGGTQSGSRCTVSDLRGGTADGGGGAAGSTEIVLTFTNTGDSACTLQGWPGVSFVGGGNGTQIGAPATLDRSSAHATETLAPGATVHAPLRIVQAANFDAADCSPTPADGFRVYPPGSEQAMFIAASGYTGCANTAEQVLSVQAIVAG
ncbi:DUF4232 domain-containing protein [Curtobacterium sp. RRHDQ10]|uniref:DUF4232 domain-containing protein n=1 Tax=Curtobacterium phyllosphaerae TaxID=3413379 RepID=UPI003BF2CC35